MISPRKIKARRREVRSQRPKRADGTFEPGWELWSRRPPAAHGRAVPAWMDGESRWVRSFAPDDSPERHLSPGEWLALYLIASILWAAIIVAIFLR
jgi:hypothetical protein